MSKTTNPEATWEVVKILRRLLRDADISINAVQQQTGISNATLTNIFHGRREPQISTLAKIAEAIDFEIEIRFVPKR